MQSRRQFLATGAGALAAPFLAGLGALTPSRLFAQSGREAQLAAWDAQVRPEGYDPAFYNPWGMHPRFLPRRVEANPGLVSGDIHVDAVARYLYHVQGDGTAMRYGAALGRGQLYEPGVFLIGRKARWPSWTPTANMMNHTPSYRQYAGGVPGGPQNPMGARALYLYLNGRDTYLRIHGTPQPETIGHRASSGCVRLVMPHIIDLYNAVETGATAHLYPDA